jgi:hypothetical protein
MIARRLFAHKLKKLNYGNKVLLINTVHDDIELDVDNLPEIVYNICIALEESFAGIPKYFEKNYGTTVNIPMAAECKFGLSLYEPEMVKFNPKTFKEDYNKLCNSI